MEQITLNSNLFSFKCNSLNCGHRLLLILKEYLVNDVNAVITKKINCHTL